MSLVLVYQEASGSYTASSGRVLEVATLGDAPSLLYTFDYSSLVFYTSGAYSVATGVVVGASTGMYYAYQWGNVGGWSLESPWIYNGTLINLENSISGVLNTKEDIAFTQGDYYVKTIALTDNDDNPLYLSGYSFKSQIRSLAEDDVVMAEFAITTDTSNGTITMILDNDQTAALNGKYVYDLQATVGGLKPKTLIYGKVTVVPEVTR